MTAPNTLLANTTYTLSHEGVCGASVVVSVALSAPAGLAPDGGTHLLAVTNEAAAVPLHVEVRTVWTDPLSAVQAAPVAFGLVSNTLGFGASALRPEQRVLLLSGESKAFALPALGGSAVRIALLAASNPASAAVVSGSVALWRL